MSTELHSRVRSTSSGIGVFRGKKSKRVIDMDIECQAPANLSLMISMDDSYISFRLVSFNISAGNNELKAFFFSLI